MKIPNAVHAAQPWVLSRIAPDFRLLDVWALPVEGDAGDFDEALGLFTSFDPGKSRTTVTRLLFQVRFKLGDLFGWDEPKRRPIPGCRETTLAARVPDSLRGTARKQVISSAMQQAAGGFEPLFRTGSEWAAELSNGTVHGVLQLTWAEQGTGRHRARMAVYVKPRGLTGEAYLKLIEPFRRWIVYPAMMRQIERTWRARGGAVPSRSHEPNRLAGCQRSTNVVAVVRQGYTGTFQCRNI
jgi:uncharacterized protein DUF2867